MTEYPDPPVLLPAAARVTEGAAEEGVDCGRTTARDGVETAPDGLIIEVPLPPVEDARAVDASSSTTGSAPAVLRTTLCDSRLVFMDIYIASSRG